ncbi:hypothetical protein [Stutzerimonas stutzeri]|uniref:hypothetical protein n=1 Tax=Stutzerimonas stutzeri TaxID=316 RepID=UPI00244D73B5|nr:hypothetical protein [Stutzerimonas stutzeri]MDH1590506.1 hypothetical protein [Stutzerimonas stutzeri]
MTCAGAKLRQRYQERMQRVAIGAQLERKGRVWLVMKQQRTETGVVLQLRHGRHDFRLYVPVTLDGPELWHAELRSAALPPAQREMFAGGAQ